MSSTEDDARVDEGPRAPRTAAQRVYIALGAVMFGLLAVAIVWIVVTGLVARAQLNAVKGELEDLRTAVSHGDLTKARALSHHIAEQTGSAHQLTSGPAWWVAANVPGLGTPLRTGRTIACQADLVGRRALPGVVDLGDQLLHTTSRNSTIDLRPLRRAQAKIVGAQLVVGTASRTIRAADPSWLPMVSGPHRDIVAQLSAIDREVSRARQALTTALPMLGAVRPQRYFLGFMNEAESRGVGGLPGAFAIFTIDHGRLQFTHFGSDDELLGVRAPVSVSSEYRSLYGQDDPTGDIRNSDVSPHFPDAARIWAAMWQAKSGQHVDGAIAVDPSAIAFLLKVTGPATLPGGARVTAANVVSLTQEQQYALYGSDSVADTRKRKTYLVTIARAVAGRILSTSGIRGLAAPAQEAIAQRRLVLWSSDATQESAVVALGLGGTLSPQRGRPFSAFVVNNAAGGKMDLYLDRTMTYRRRSCAAGAATATLVLHNDTPSYALPPYVTTVLGTKPVGAKPGFNRLVLAYYATPGAVLGKVTVDGALVSVTKASERGLPTARLLVELPAGATRTVRVAVREPASGGPVDVLRQPGVRDIRVHTSTPACS
ncbi:MAG: hypothetical protein JWO15_3803 [Sphingomonadales bacterium]|nr:hypothetical protein [Sphingomonadales bacterium]